MLRMAVGQSDDVDVQTAVQEAIAQCRAQLSGVQPSAGIFFCAIDSWQPGLIDLVRVAFPGVDIIGASSAAEVSSVGGYLEDSVALALFASGGTVTTGVGLATQLDADLGGNVRAAVDAALAGRSPSDVRLCIVLADPAYAQRAAEALNPMLPEALVV